MRGAGSDGRKKQSKHSTHFQLDRRQPLLQAKRRNNRPSLSISYLGEGGGGGFTALHLKAGGGMGKGRKEKSREEEK